MITEDYVSYEVAKLLKEKGFDEKCQKVYMHNGQLLWASIFMEGESFVDNECIEDVANYNDWITYTQGEYAYLCPTHQMAMKWLREVHKLAIIVSICNENNKGNTDYSNPDRWFYFFDITNTKGVVIDVKYNPLSNEFPTYEEAVETAIKYTLENLI